MFFNRAKGLRFLPSEQWVIVARFYSRSDAEGHFQFLRRNLPNARFRVVFDVLDESRE